MNMEMTTWGTFLERLRRTEPLVLRRDGALPEWDDEPLHRDLWARDPETYALTGLLDFVAPWQRARILFQLLRTSRRGIHPEVGETLDRVASVLLAAGDPDQVLTVFLAVRRVRANHKHTARLLVRWVLDHPEAEDLVRRRRPAVIDCLEHALGRDVLRGCVRRAREAGHDDPYLRRHLLRRGRDEARTLRLLPLLDRSLPAPTLPDGEPRCTQVHLAQRVHLDTRRERPAAITAFNRGDIAALLVQRFRGDTDPRLDQALEEAVDRATALLPRFGGRVALVLDMSASMRGYGDRELCVLAQSLALRLVLARCCRDLDVSVSGGRDGVLPEPEGDTDLAGALLDALAAEPRPDLVLIASDGYENRCRGDLARVAASLPQVGVTTPVVFCQAKFTSQDDLTLRRPAPDLPQAEFWHEQDFAPLLVSAFARAAEPNGDGLREFGLEKLRRAEQEMTLWTTR